MLTDPVDRLLLDQAPDVEGRVLLLDCPGLLETARERWADVELWCDDLRHAAPGQPEVPTFDDAQLVLAQLPKSLDALADQASRAAAAGATYLGGERVKHLSRSMNDVLARYFDDVHATRGVGKCRGLVGAQPKPRAKPTTPKSKHNAELGLDLVAYGRTFAGARLDAGTRLLLTTQRRWPEGNAVDVGCGNGVLTAVLARRGNPTTAIDVSADAVRSTRITLASNNLTADVLWSDGLTAIPDHSVDLIVTNPPFHVGQAKDSTPTLNFLADATRALAPGGEIYVVYNAHLPYLQALGDAFGHADIIARDRDYLVARARA